MILTIDTIPERVKPEIQDEFSSFWFVVLAKRNKYGQMKNTPLPKQFNSGKNLNLRPH